MDKNNLWKKFEQTGNIEYYLEYIKEKNGK